jgi:signal transduction histidine kinase
VIARVRSFLFSFQTKLVLSLTAVIALAIFVAGTAFVIQTRNDRRQEALDRVAAASPSIYQQAFLALLPREDSDDHTFEQALDDLGQTQHLRILVVAPDGSIVHDTGDKLTGEQVEVPHSSPDDIQRGFVSWQPSNSEFPESGLTLVTASSRFVTTGGRELPFRIVLAVHTDTIASAWLDLLPSLLLAALIAVPLASIAGILLARQVAQPVAKLTAASEAMALGDFDQRVEVDRSDEVGRLARAFTRMAQRVGNRDSQMRALLANVSHDLKTPMTSITGYAQALSDGTAGPEDARRIGNVISDEAHHVNSLLADLLYLGEIDAGEVVTHREDLPLVEVVGRCVRRIEPTTHANDVEVAVDITPDAILRDVDPDKLERALTNVLDNAAKFTPPGGEIMVVGRRENGALPARVVCSITNSGATIAEDDLPRVFDRFFRGDRARRTASGSGLGLAITRELVELNGGTISVANERDGTGVTFTVALPG